MIGLGMIGQWSFSYTNRQIPELKTEPIRIGFHIAAEFITAAALIVAGLGFLTSQPCGTRIYPAAVGMLLCTAIVSPGYLAQIGKRGWVGLFAVILLLALASLVLVFT